MSGPTDDLVPGEVLIDARPVGAKGSCEQEFLDRQSGDLKAGECRQIPHSLDVAGSRPFKTEQEHRVIAQEKDGTDAGLWREVGTAEHRRKCAEGHANDRWVNRIPREWIE